LGNGEPGDFEFGRNDYEGMRTSFSSSCQVIVATACGLFAGGTFPQETAAQTNCVDKPGLYHSLTEPPCSYCSTQNRKGLVRNDDLVIAWIRGAHNGGAIPIRHFLAAPRVINDTYGLFFYDPDGGYVSAFKKDKGYEFQGWRNGAMVVKGADGTLWSALSGRALEGPKKGQRLERQPSFLTEWGYWLMLHPESTAYNLFDGKKYPVAELPGEMSVEAKATMGKTDARLEPGALVLGVESGSYVKAFPLEQAGERACFTDRQDGIAMAIFWYRPTRSAIAFSSRLKDRFLSFYADDASPETAPFKDKETGSRWTLAGRAVDGPLRGQELEWVNSVQCRWYAWAAEFPETLVFEAKAASGK
jgi:hypothetical protein